MSWQKDDGLVEGHPQLAHGRRERTDECVSGSEFPAPFPQINEVRDDVLGWEGHLHTSVLDQNRGRGDKVDARSQDSGMPDLG